jgi:hypothetical protein
MIPVYTFGFSLLAIAALIYFRHLEERRGVMYGETFRLRLDEVVVRSFLKMKQVPKIFGWRGWEHVFHDSVVFVLHQLSLLALFLVRFLERRLVRLVNFVKGKHVSRTDAGVSIFLQDMTGESKTLKSIHERKAGMRKR